MVTGREPLRPYCIGLTGGIASGKSTVAEAFARRGIAVVDTDLIARRLVEPGSPALERIAKHFGPTVIGPDGRLDRAGLRRIAFADARARQDLEAILHPVIRAEAARQVAVARSLFVILVVPLLIEHRTDYAPLVDRILVVDCPPGTQMRRLLQRDGGDAATAQAILSAQTGRDARLAAADDVIENSGGIASLDARVTALCETYRALADEKMRNLPT